jgi:hypothetical protein
MVVEVRPLPPDAVRNGGGGRRNGAKASKQAPPRRKTGRRGAKGQGLSSLDRIAREQGVTRVVPFNELLGGWPPGEQDDGFEAAVANWRAEEPRSGAF